jgi:poly(3-hydroxybutyrate) depolymerase
VCNAEKRLGTAKSKIVKEIASGGHIGLFMGSKPLRENWPKIAKWIRKYSEGRSYAEKHVERSKRL